MSVITISFCSHAGPLPASVELLTRIELVTSSLPRKCSTTELQQQVSFRTLSGRRGSNPRPPAWKASALSTELLPRFLRVVGGDGFEPPKAYASRFTVCPIWPLWYPPLKSLCSRCRTANHLENGCKGRYNF